MSNQLKNQIKALGIEISVYATDFETDYISLTDIARYKNRDNPAEVINNWMRSQNTINFLLAWEKLYSTESSVRSKLFKLVDFDKFKISPSQWVEQTGSLGFIVRRGRYGGGTLAHKDIAFEFASWISPEFKLYIIKDYQRLKENESNRESRDWSLRREISRINYKIHTNAIRKRLIPFEFTDEQLDRVYANEADVLNTALFGMTAQEWRDKNPKQIGNLRDFATLEQLLVLSNLENYNSILIRQGIPQKDRLILLRQVVKEQLEVLIDSPEKKLLR